MAEDDERPKPGDRRLFLKVVTGAVGGGIGATLLVPAARLLLDPMDRSTVTAADQPIDAIAVADLGDLPVKVPLVASSVRDAWNTTTDVPLGAAWVRKDDHGKVQVMSGVCPHLGCAVAFNRDAREFRCPCHDSAFSPAGVHLRGPAERGLDPLPYTVSDDGRVMVTWVRYRAGGSTGEKV